nr:MAG TPA: hypothetical protein [Caudoviricetes sp.]DAZ25424.1 MAG TPA: hypothetical protein [Caudoviricetes sp.]
MDPSFLCYCITIIKQNNNVAYMRSSLYLHRFFAE